LAQVVYFFANNFLFFQPSFGYICLQQPSFAFTGEVPEEAFGGIFRRPARAAGPAEAGCGWPESKLTVPTSLML
jgi:hypothetical protein